MLRDEHESFQAVLRGFDAPLYSATRQQVIRLLRRIRKQNCRGLKRKKEYPTTLRRDVFNVRETENRLAKFRVKVPIQLPRNQEEPLSLSIREGKLIWRGDHWSPHITVMKEVQLMPEPPSTILAIYKAQWRGIQVYKGSERYTSKISHRCGSEGERLSQARLKCPSCGLDYFSADLNGAINIAERPSSYIGWNGAAFDTAMTLGK
ncbi:MAG: transposase [Nitrososphaerales archaeon]